MSHAPERPVITVEDFLAGAPARLQLNVLAGRRGAAGREIDVARIQKLGLALAGFAHYIHPGRVQIVGQSEIWYLGQLSSEKRREAIQNLALEKISCVLVTKELSPPKELLEEADLAALPVIQTPLVSSIAIVAVTEFLQEALAPREVRHGVLLDLYGLGVLIEGKSGIGKSECALDLIVRGHRLIADDLVEIRRTRPEQLIGSAPDLLRDHIEIRGLGILNIRDLFGVSAISESKVIGLSISLNRWEESGEVDRLGLDARTVEILGIKVPNFLLPVSPGRNLSTLVETAVRVHLLRTRGYNAAQAFVVRHAEMMNAMSEAESRASLAGVVTQKSGTGDEREEN
ncbi:MAG TPA: HPr(Ser) kinase/phosphatase [Pyrinomonadaceae bacterium]|jgi:HPr kinase/phosphorylase|nr:HPr(Ser) kinase/phosphatase [Pyrinomonadaceae bacterium]